MLEKTFVHVQGVGYSTERRLWEAGAACWRTFLEDPAAYRLPRVPAALVHETVARSEEALRTGDFRFFARSLAARDHWRGLTAFPGRVGFLDIETDGGTDFDSVTVVGLHDGRALRQFVRGENLLDFEEALEDVAVLVTFYGGGFDLPVLRRAFPRLRFDQLHLDLCPALRRLGYRGGLKSVERQLGLERGPETAGLDGWDAVRLWREWRRGREASLATLLAYNAADVENMIPLSRTAYRLLEARTLGVPEADRAEAPPGRCEREAA